MLTNAVDTENCKAVGVSQHELGVPNVCQAPKTSEQNREEELSNNLLHCLHVEASPLYSAMQESVLTQLEDSRKIGQ